MKLTFRCRLAGRMNSLREGPTSCPRRAGRKAAMGTFAGKNGHPAEASALGQPHCDRVYHRIAREFLEKCSLAQDEGFIIAVARRLREGPAKVCCRAIGGWIDQKLL